jgi:hypothetical protein
MTTPRNSQRSSATSQKPGQKPADKLVGMLMPSSNSAAATWLTRREATEATFREIETQIFATTGADAWMDMTPGLEHSLEELKGRLGRLEKLIEQRETTAARRRLDASRGRSNAKAFNSSIDSIGDAGTQFAADRAADFVSRVLPGPSLFARFIAAPAIQRIARLLFGPPAKPPAEPAPTPQAKVKPKSDADDSGEPSA